MLNNFKNLLVGVLSAVIVIAIGASAYNAYASGGISFPSFNLQQQPTYGQGGGNGRGNGQGQGGAGQGQNPGLGGGADISAIPASDLSAEEAAGLLFMREEEKLARDVYNQMYALWGTPVFQNIAASEQQHMNQVKLLMDRYGLTDPALPAGQFADANLQALYNQLVAQGSASQAEALKVGALVEETDIKDLQARLAQTDNADIQFVYNNLLNASNNHLAAFNGQAGQGQRAGQGQSQGAQGQGGNRQGGAGQGNQGQGGGVGMANISSATTVHGVVTNFDGFGFGMTADDGKALYVQLGNYNYVQSLGFAPQAGTGVTVYGFTGDQGAFTAITVTMDGAGQVYNFREATGRPSWAGGNGKNGNH